MDKKFFAKIMIYFGLMTSSIFIGLGVILMFFPYFPFIPDDMKMLMGFFFLVYGIFRLVRIILQFKELRNDNNN